MSPQNQDLLDRIQCVELAIEQEAKTRRDHWQSDFEAHKLRFEKEVLV